MEVNQYFSHLMQRTDSLAKTLVIEKDRRQEKETTENEMASRSQYEFEQARGIDGQGRVPLCRPWGCKESDMTEEQLATWQHVVMSFPSPLSELAEET